MVSERYLSPGCVLDEESVSQCNTMLVGLKIGSYCGTIASKAEENFQPVLDIWSNFEADTMITILEQATNKKVGDPVSIPVRVVNEVRDGKHETAGVEFDQFES